jgi:hypothetical protein
VMLLSGTECSRKGDEQRAIEERRHRACSQLLEFVIRGDIGVKRASPAELTSAATVRWCRRRDDDAVECAAGQRSADAAVLSAQAERRSEAREPMQTSAARKILLMLRWAAVRCLELARIWKLLMTTPLHALQLRCDRRP